MFFKRKKLIEIDAKVDDLLRITAGQSKMEQDHWNSLEQNQQPRSVMVSRWLLPLVRLLHSHSVLT